MPSGRATVAHPDSASAKVALAPAGITLLAACLPLLLLRGKPLAARLRNAACAAGPAPRGSA